jgi:SAM-dependent methyltransferase
MTKSPRNTPRGPKMSALKSERYTQILLERLSQRSRVLELGCGSGVPTSYRLATRFELTDVDISAKQIELARKNVPAASFIQADMIKLSFDAGTFDAVAAFYSITHVPRDEQRPLIKDIARWLRPGGLFVASLSTGATAGVVEQNWVGAPTYFSGYDAQTNREMVERTGLNIISTREETEEEFGKPTTFLWIVAKKP